MSVWTKLNTPMYIGLIMFIAFVAGVLVLSGREKFTQMDVPMTIAEFKKLPAKLGPVKQYPYVTDHDYYYGRFGG
jgi:hypothetical protein